MRKGDYEKKDFMYSSLYRCFVYGWRQQRHLDRSGRNYRQQA